MKTKRRTARKIPIRGLVFQEGDWLSVRCLPLPQLYKSLNRLILGHIAVRLHHNQRPFESLPPTPRKYWDMFERSKIAIHATNVRPARSNGFVVPPPELRVALEDFGL